MKRSVIIDNTRPRYDTTGNPVDAHDGCLEFFGGRYWLYGTAYGAQTGYVTGMRYRIYSSADLSHDGWTNHGDALTHTPPGLHSRPYVKRCPGTGKYVMWYNYFTGWIGEKNFAAGDGPIKPVVHRVAVADSPEGPFETVTKRASTRFDHVGDHGLFVDDDGSGYLIYTASGSRFQLTIEKLRDDFLDTTGRGTEPLAESVEAPSLFKRRGSYYAVFDRLCCFCPQGSGARVYRAKHPMGPWEYRNNINRDENTMFVPAQQTHIARLTTAGDDVFMWMGDRWQTGGSHNRGADLQYWSEPLRFNADGDIQPLRFVERWNLEHVVPG